MSPGPVELHIDIAPRGKQRHRTGRNGRTYTPNETKLAEAQVRDAWTNRGGALIDGPTVLEVMLVLERPQGHWRRDGSLSAAGIRSVYPTKKPDWDNAGKLISDALNKLAFTDDAYIVDGRVRKRWANPGEGAHVVVRVSAAPMPALRNGERPAAPERFEELFGDLPSDDEG